MSPQTAAVAIPVADHTNLLPAGRIRRARNRHHTLSGLVKRSARRRRIAITASAPGRRIRHSGEATTAAVRSESHPLRSERNMLDLTHDEARQLLVALYYALTPETDDLFRRVAEIYHGPNPGEVNAPAYLPAS